MTGHDPDKSGKPGNANPSEEELANSLRSLDERLDRKRGQATRQDAGAASGYAVGMKLSSEFVAAILVGAAIGWGLDRLLGTSPWAMIVFLLLGFCAGVVGVMRSAGLMSDPRGRAGPGGN
jgi:ATP synthase protein I